MKVTDKNIYLEAMLIKDLDKAVERQNKKWDSNIIIDGEEGSGKTTLSWGIGYYLAWKTGRKFDVDNIFFDVSKMMKFAVETRKQIIIWDEAALEALATNWQSSLQKQLIKILMTARKNGHFFIFLIPKFYKLTEYIAVDRSIMLLHTYSPDNLTRGYFTAYNRKKKEFFYEKFRSSRRKPYHDFTYRGTYPKAYISLINEEAYEAKKDKAIASILIEDTKSNPSVEKLKRFQYLLYTYPFGNQKDKAVHWGVDPRTIRKWSENPIIDSNSPRETPVLGGNRPQEIYSDRGREGYE